MVCRNNGKTLVMDTIWPVRRVILFKGYLEKKEFRLATLEAQSAAAVKVITDAVANLEKVNADIDRTAGEIAEYQMKLNSTLEQLSDQKKKNEKLLNNFNKLLS